MPPNTPKSSLRGAARDKADERGASTMPRKMLAAERGQPACDAERVPKATPCRARPAADPKQQRGHHAHDQDDRQRLKRQDEIRA
jgi:hypothetical protein